MSKYEIGDLVTIRREYDPGEYFFTIYAILGTYKIKAVNWCKVLYLTRDTSISWNGIITDMKDHFIAKKQKNHEILERDLGFLAVYGSPLTIVQNFLNTKLNIKLDEQEQEARKILEGIQATIDAVADFKQKILE